MDNQTLLIGFGYLMLGAVCGGSFGLPSKYVRKETPWEVLWGTFFFFVTIAMPCLLGPVLVKDFFLVFQRAGVAGLAMPLLFGFLWGAGSMTLGMSFAFIGLSLAYSLNYGAQIIFGTIAPMVIHHRDKLFTPQGHVILLGVAVLVLGVILSGRAGILKDRSSPRPEAATPSGARQPRMMVGLIVAILSGVFCACYGVAASYTGPIADTASALGNEPWRASCVTTVIILWGGACSAFLYCAILLAKNGTWKHFAAPGIGLTLGVALLMALLHNGAIYLFNLGFPMLGKLGVSVGYAAFMSLAIIVGNVHGFRTGEWRARQPLERFAWIIAGIAVLILGVCVLAKGNAMGLVEPR